MKFVFQQETFKSGCHSTATHYLGDLKVPLVFLNSFHYLQLKTFSMDNY